MRLVLLAALHTTFCCGFYVNVKAQSFKAGAYMVDITPRLGTAINGGYYSGYTQKIHDPVHAKALVLQNNGVTVAIVIVDICYMENAFLKETRDLIQRRTKIKAENILIAATHTHSAGAVEQWCLAYPDMLYRSQLPALISKAVENAKRRLRPAAIALGSEDVPQHVVCRRYIMKSGYTAKNPVSGGYDVVKTNPFGAAVDEIVRQASPVDPEFSYLAIKGQDGKWISVLGNYSMHYVGDVEPNTISADYFGEFSNSIKRKLNADSDFVGMLSNGTSGDANIIDFMHPDRYPKGYYEKTRLIANDLSEVVTRGLGSLKWQNDPKVRSVFTMLPVAIRKPTDKEVKNAEQVVAETDYVNLQSKPFDDDQNHRLYMLEQLVVNSMPDSIGVAIQAIKIGSIVIGGLGGEIFSETGLYLKSKSATKSYFTISNANGYVGYIPTAKDLELGGYETWRCRSSLLESKGESLIRSKLLEEIYKLK